MSAYVEWNVYVNGKYVGTVFARNEEAAIAVALIEYGDSERQISISKR